MPKDVTAISTYLATRQATEPIIVIAIHWSTATIYYSDKDLGNALGGDVDNARGRILQSPSLNMSLKTSSASAVNSITVTLCDYDYSSSIKHRLDTEDIYTVEAEIYISLDSNEATLMHGRIVSPVEWDEAARTFTLTIETNPMDTEIGYSVLDSQVTAPYPSDLIGQPWPIAFGTVREVPALKLNEIPYGTIRSELTKGTATIKVNGGDNFPTTEATYVLGGNRIVGAFNGETFTIKNYSDSDGGLLDRYTSIPVGARVSGDPDVDDKRVFWLTDESYELCEFQVIENGRENYCYKQEGKKCYMQYYCTKKLDTGDSITAASTSLTGSVTGAWSFDWRYPSGTAIYPLTNTEEIWITNYLGNADTYGVYTTRRQPNGDDVLVSIPKDFYDIDDSYDTTAYVSGGPIVSAIKLVKPLKFYRYGNFGGKIYVDIKSAAPSSDGDNTAAQIEYILTTFTGLTMDATTLASVKTAVSAYPSNFQTREKVSALSFVEKMAQLARCAITYRSGKAYLHYLGTEPSSVRTITLDDIIIDTLKITTTDSFDIMTAFKAKWRLDYRNAPRYKVLEGNISDYGYREMETDFSIYTQEECVDKTNNFFKNRKSHVWKRVSFKTILTTLELDAFDCFLFDSDGYLATGSVKCVVEEVTHNTEDSTISITAWTPVAVGTMVAHADAWQDDSGDSTPSLALTDEQIDYTLSEEVTANSSYAYSSGDGIVSEDLAEGEIAVDADEDDFEFVDGTLTLKGGGGGVQIATITATLSRADDIDTYRIELSAPATVAVGDSVTAGDIYKYGETNYKALRTFVVEEISLPPNTTFWTKDADYEATVLHQTASLLHCAPWFQIGDSVPVQLIDGEYKILATCPRIENGGVGSLYWDQNEQRLKAVYK